jgi:CzcA family heavy metal efflux pump
MIRSIIESSLRFRPLVIAIAVIVMIAGIARLEDMPVDVFPEILPVTVNVQTEALGLSAKEVEQLITVPIEADLLAGTPWVDVMRSESVPGLSSIELTFKRGTNPMHARQMVQERLTQAHALPNVSKPPQMLQPLSSTNRVMLIGLSSKTQSLIEMSVLARWTIRPRLMGVPGVANVAIWGQRERQLQVQVDPERLREKKVSLIQIVKTAGNALWYSPLSFLESSVAGTGGFIETPNQRLGVRHVLPISVASDLAKVPVEGTSMPLSQVATVVEDHQPLIGDALNSGGPGLLLVIEKLPGVNTLEVDGEIWEALEALKPGVGGIEFDPNVYRPAGYIRTAIGNVAIAFLIGLILIAVMLLALSYDWRAALVGVVAIPLSLMAALLVVYWSGATINVMVLAGLLIALGVVIDDGIVLADSLLKRLRGGGAKSMARTLLEVSAEKRSALLFATAIVLLAALPMLFMTGAAGAFFKPMVLSYGLAVLASLVVAITVTPALCLMLFHKTQLVRRESPFAGWLKQRFDRMSPRVPRLAVAFAIVATVVGVAVVPRLKVPAAPMFKEPDLVVDWAAVPGTSRGEMDRVIDRAIHELKSIPGVRNVGGHVGRAILSDQVVGIHSGELWVSLDSEANYEKTVAAVEEVVGGYPGIDGDVMTFLRSRFGEALSGVDEPIVVRLYGQDHTILQREAEKVQQAVAQVSGIVDSRVELESNEPVVEIKVDLEAARSHGVKPGDVRRAAATLLAGIEVGNLFEEQKVFEVVVWGMPQVRHSVSRIRNLLIDTPTGGHVLLGDVASVRIVPTPNVIRRENVARTLDIVANVKGRDVNAVAADVSRGIGELAFPLEYRAELVGDFARQRIAQQRVLWVTIAVAIGILLVLQAAFGSWPMAFALLLSLPIALAGGAIAAAATGTTLSLAALAGFLTVLGIAVRHAILLIHRYRDLRSQGMSFGPDLVVKGARERANAVLIAALVTAAGALPFAVLGARPGLEILGPMAVVILGGLVTATVYTLCVVPALYARFGAAVVAEAVDDGDLDIAPSEPELQPIS